MPRLITVASCALNQTSMDFEGNLERILESCREALKLGAKIRSGPELEISGYGCGDHFLELDTFQHSWEVLMEIMKSEEVKDLLCDIGMPVLHRGSRYNCRVFIWNRRVLLIRPKMYMADEGNYRESRWFNCWSRPGEFDEYSLPAFMHSLQKTAPFGDAVLDFADTTIAAEICEELFAPMSPHLSLALAGNVEIFLNGSASHHEIGKLRRRFNLILGATAKVGGIYLYSNQMGCDGDRLYFDGSAMVSLNGHLLAQSPQFSLKKVEVITATVDLDLIQILRGNRPSFTNQAADSNYIFPFKYSRINLKDICLCHSESESFEIPVTHVIEPFYHPEDEEIGLGPALWLWDYLRKSGAGGFYIPLSGGLDSGSCALIVYTMCKMLSENLKHVQDDLAKIIGTNEILNDPREICGRILYTCYLGTTNSTESSRLRAQTLATTINSNHSTYFIDSVLNSVINLFKTICGKNDHVPKYHCLGGSRQEGLALQNLQARLRLTLSYYYAQLVAALKGSGSLLVIATGNCDEGLSGYFTKYDCSSGDLNPIGSICKNDLRRFVNYVMNSYNLNSQSIRSIIEAIPAAELEPGTADYEQTDEADMGITYEELERFGKLRSNGRCGPYSMFNRLRASYPNTPAKDHYSRVAFFFLKYSANRHKMTTLPPAYHAMSSSPDDNRFDLRPFLYGQWTWQFKRIEKDLNFMTATSTRRLVNSIIRCHFGESVQFVADVLLLKGDSNLSTLVQSSGLSGKVVREALFVLIQHSLVLYNSSIAPNSQAPLYRLDTDAILARVAFGQIVTRVGEKISIESAYLLLEIIVAGRLKASLALSKGEEALKSLLKEGIIEIVTPEMGQFSYDSSVPVVSLSEKRKLDEDILFPSGKKTKLSSSDSSNSSSPSETFIRFNSKESAFRFILTEKIVEIVTNRMNKSAGIVAETILSLGEGFSNNSNESLITFNTFQLSQKIPKDLQFPLESGNSSSNGLSASPLLQYLHLLCQNFDFIQNQSSLGANAFSFNIKMALRHLRLMLIESFIRARFGLPSARIFKILLSKKKYEERQIAKVAMITSKEVRERLYTLLKVGLVHLQEVPKSADHAPSRTIFLWSVPENANFLQPSKSALFRNFGSKLITGLVNLRDLIVIERRKHSQLLEKVERSDVSSNLDLLSPAEQKQLADLRKVLKVLNVKIDQIYNEFIIFKE